MNRRIPSLNEFISATNNLGYDGQVTQMGDAVKKSSNTIAIDVKTTPAIEIKAMTIMIPELLGKKFIGKSFGFESDYKTYVMIDIDKTDPIAFEDYLFKNKIQFEKAKGYKILLTDDNINKFVKIKKENEE
jgi:hypothetical protein